MAESLPRISPSPDMAGIANLGFQLATKLEIYGLGTRFRYDNIPGFVGDILGTASALDQLREFIAADSNEALPVYKYAGREDIEDLAIRCGKVYTTIVRTVYRASLSTKVVEGVDFESIGANDLKASRIYALRGKIDWDLVEDVLETSGKHLAWLRASLLLHIQVARLANLQIKSPRGHGSFDEELASRALAVRVLMAKVKCANSIVEDAERTARLALADKSDTESVRSGVTSSSGDSEPDDDAASWKSGETAKDSKPSSVCNDKVGEKTKAPIVVEPVVEATGPSLLPPAAPTSFWHQPFDSPDGSLDAAPVEIKLVGPNRRFPAKVFKSMGKWLKGLFGRNAAPCIDDLELEATVLRNGPFPETFLSFEPKMLRRELKRVLKRRSDTPPDSFLTEDSQLQFAVRGALVRAQKKDGRVRQLVAVDLSTRPEVAVVFMSVEPAMEPVHFTDILGRKFNIPYEQCRTLKGARDSIHRRFKDVNRLWHLVRDGVFEIVGEDGVVITPEAWATTIKPGAVLQMRVAAFNDGVNGGMFVRRGTPEALTWAEPYLPPQPPAWRNGRFGPPGCPPGMPRPGMGGPPPPPPCIITIDPPRQRNVEKRPEPAELGFEPDFGPEVTRDGELGEGSKDLGRWLALWTNATDTDFSTDSGEVPSYDYAESVSTSSSSSMSDEIVYD